MTFTTPHGRVRYRLPWSWSAFDYRELCRLLWAQCGAARFETAKVDGRAPGDARPHRPRRPARAAGRRRAGLAARAGPAARPAARRAALARPGGPPGHDGSRRRARRVGRARPRAPRLRLARARRAARRASASAPTTRAARQGADRRAGARAGRRRRALPGQLVPAPPARRDRGRRVLRGRQRRALLPAVGRGDPHGVLLRDRLRARAAGGAGRRAGPRACADRLRGVPRAPPPRLPPRASACSGSSPRCRRGC